jgi:hypothetical protein
MSQLRVNGIATSGGTDALLLKPSGAVGHPNQTMFHAFSSGGSFASGSTITFTQIAVNVGSGYSSANSRFTVPIAGTYYFYTTMLSTNDSGAIDFRFYKNDTTAIGAGYTGAFASGYKQTSGMTMATLNVGDFITIRSFGTASIHADIVHNYFGGWLIG